MNYLITIQKKSKCFLFLALYNLIFIYGCRNPVYLKNRASNNIRLEIDRVVVKTIAWMKIGEKKSNC